MRYILSCLIIPLSVTGVNVSSSNGSWSVKYDGNGAVATIFVILTLIMLWKLRQITAPAFKRIESRFDYFLRSILIMTGIVTLFSFSHTFSDLPGTNLYRFGNTGNNHVLILSLLIFWNSYKLYQVMTDPRLKNEITPIATDT
jgi:hypothetical protein